MKVMSSCPDIVKVVALIGDPSRVSILISLLGGKSIPASELARTAKISPQTASSHLRKMVEGGLIIHESIGRHRYFQLASAEIGHALEALLTIAQPKQIRSLRESDQLVALRFARTCYDHIAGEIGVALTNRMLELGFIMKSGEDFILSAEGKERLIKFGVNVEETLKSRRHFARQCLDWSEREHHLAGSLGAALTNRLFELKWIKRLPEDRAVLVTDIGIKGFSEEFGLPIRA